MSERPGSGPSALVGEGQEVLVVDADLAVQRGLEQLFRRSGLTPTVLGDLDRALEAVTEKFFAVALVDADTPQPEEGLRRVTEFRERSPETALVVLAPRRSYEVAVRAFRAGADDVVVKTPDQVDYLRNKVVSLAAGKRRKAENEQLLGRTYELHEELMKVLLETYRRLSDFEERQSGGAPSYSSDETTRVLLAEDDGWLGESLRSILGERGGYALASVATGGEALDLSGRERFHIALVKDALPDLPGTMVGRTVKAQSPDTLVLLYRVPSHSHAGSIEIVDAQRSIEFLPVFTEAGQLAARLDDLRAAFHATAKERRYLSAFRQQHFDLLKRYADLRQKLQRAARSPTDK
jgi:DNA-binding response OmpR family regulator